LSVLFGLSVGGSAAARADGEPFLRAFADAAESIRQHQKPAGYWDTAVTPSAAFESPNSEVNVFTPALIVDLLEPVSAQALLADVLQRARQYLGRQIEPTGLVRYHGDPGHVTSAQRGCELPPDTDDTALVWRIAPRGEADLLAAARERLQQNRTAEGLYPTWLADTTEYRCFYDTFFPHDPNPPDVGIQMHLYLFLAKYDPQGAHALCEALRAHIAEERLWVWYAVAPLVPLLREADLARAGCSVGVPEKRLERSASGQDVYVTAGRLLRDLLLDAEPRPSPEHTLRILDRLAARDFAALKEAPPLLYHNALSASPPHYHWSEDVGYALWLRLYVESARRWAGSLPLPAAAP
jgi:hypothetical protein